MVWCINGVEGMIPAYGLLWRICAMCRYDLALLMGALQSVLFWLSCIFSECQNLSNSNFSQLGAHILMHMPTWLNKWRISIQFYV
ncbi:hypothetical protein K402DRAFT_203044 [Aulographum hederae CBS 113979]|uniref:Uncharacterized protein n=1 Tax=Aulographum hederae CBS 113979 TaxID=1176131 RepID=A0A6G1HCV1_9PEZI|nr:hypothetical protein K402DRAFT_203044 [Aulographum hederae CBS 113979]